MSQMTTLDKKINNQPLSESKFKIKLKEFIHPLVLAMSKSKITYKINKVNKCDAIIGKPIIFAVNHTNCNDIPIACNVIKDHGYLLIGKQGLEKLDELFFALNGVVYVDRKDKSDTKLSKDAMCEYLNKNKNLIVFPEGTWNLTENLLMLKMKWGIVDVAKETNAQIIPVVLDYDDETKICNAKFGDKIVVNQDSDKKETIEQLRDAMATIKWEFLETRGEFKREEVSKEDFNKKIDYILKEYKKLDPEYEKSVVFKPEVTAEQAFEPVKKIGIKKETAFMYGKNKKGNW